MRKHYTATFKAQVVQELLKEIVSSRESIFVLTDGSTIDYTQLAYRIIPIYIQPKLACADAFFPLDEDEDIRKDTLSLTSEDILTFSLFTDKGPTKTMCVIIWFKSSQRASKLIASRELDQISKDERQYTLIATA